MTRRSVETWGYRETADGEEEEYQKEITTFEELADWNAGELENANHHSLNEVLDSFRAFLCTLDGRTDIPEDVLDGIWNGVVSMTYS